MGRAEGNESTVFLVGAVADPTKRFVLKVAVGRATVPAKRMAISGCGLARDQTPRPGLREPLVASGGMHWGLVRGSGKAGVMITILGRASFFESSGACLNRPEKE